MSLNLQAKDSYHVFDSAGMLCIPSDQSWEKRSWWKKLWDWILKREWIPTWSNKSWRDSLGRTVLAWIAYGMPEELLSSIEECWSNEQMKLYRHPTYSELASRDHHSYFIIIEKLARPGSFNNLIKILPRMRGMNLWMKSLTGNKLAERLYYLIYIPGALIGNAWLKFCRCVGRIGPERDNNWWIKELEIISYNGLELQLNRTKWQKLWGRIISISIPAYALHNKAWQIYVMPDSKRKEHLKRILLRRVGKSNIMLRLLFGEGKRTLYDDPNYPNIGVYKSEKGVTKEEINNYPHMTGYRPGAYLNTTSRTIKELTEQEAEWNTFEKSLIQWLWD